MDKPDVSPVIANQDVPNTATSNAVPVPSSVDKNNENDTPKKGIPKSKVAKKRKKVKDLTAPRQPLTGYVRFLNDRREQFRADNPNMSFTEITKVLAAEWTALPQEQKQQYLLAAEQDRERYLQEMAAYKQSEAYRIFSEQKSGKRPKEEPTDQVANPPPPDTSSVDQSAGYDIPIFTEEFLDHNKSREAELRQLRKSNTDYEQQNATIETYLAGLRNTIEKLTVETQQQRNNNAALEQHLSHLRKLFYNTFSNINIPNLEAPTAETIDAYMVKLNSFVQEDPNHPLVNKIRFAVSQLDLHA